MDKLEMKIMQRNFPWVLSFLVAISIGSVLTQINISAALTAAVTGTIKNKVTLEPIDGAVIRSSGIGATISKNGEYMLSEVPGTWTLEALAGGYEPYTLEIIIGEEDDLIRIDILMDPIDDVTTTTTTTCTPCPCESLYGEYSSEADLLRYFRDNVLSRTKEGRQLINLYYQWSPMIAREMEEDDAFKEDVKEMIDGVLMLIAEEK